MQFGMIGLGRMGANMARRAMRAGHHCVAYSARPETARRFAAEGAVAATSLAELVAALEPPRTVWMMIPAAAVGGLVDELAGLLAPGDVLIDGGNSNYRDAIGRAGRLATRGIRYLDVGTSGGIWGLEAGYCLMIGGGAEAVRQVEPLLAALAPGVGAAPRTPDRTGEPAPAEQGYLHCGPSGAGHFVKMIHNGIEYGVMAAYAEGLNILHHADAGLQEHRSDAETAPLADPEAYRYDFDIPAITELWRRGSVVRSWLLDLVAHALHADPGLERFEGRVSDSGEGRWAVKAAIDTATPAPVLSAALYSRFGSRGEDRFASQVLAAMRAEFGGHAEPPARERGP
ncbi:MAG: decarboxylating 6-phosphogluconate dehydrogenase [Steroidobacteraceae bacterium]